MKDTHIALLRGINVGGKNRLPMKELAPLFAELGCKDVRTYVQSGNVVYRADGPLADRVPDAISAAIADRVGLSVPVVGRTADDLHAVSEANPFPDADPKRVLVAFLADAPDPARVAALDPDRSPGDAFVVRGREVYLHCPNGFGRSKLTTAWLDRKLGTTSTIRSWKTVLALVDLTR